MDIEEKDWNFFQFKVHLELNSWTRIDNLRWNCGVIQNNGKCRHVNKYIPAQGWPNHYPGGKKVPAKTFSSAL